MIEKNILKLITKNLDLSKEYFDILSALRRLEKIADRAVSIANLLTICSSWRRYSTIIIIYDILLLMKKAYR